MDSLPSYIKPPLGLFKITVGKSILEPITPLKYEPEIR